MTFEEAIHFKQLSFKGESLCFVHANGYQPEAYHPLLSVFFDRFSVTWFKLRPLWPNIDSLSIDSWVQLADDYYLFIQQNYKGPLVSMGHSVGAIVSLLVEIKYPGTFKSIILLDPVLFPFETRLGTFFYRSVIPFMGIVKQTYSRKIRFNSIEDVFVHYRSKSIFKWLSDASLRHYIGCSFDVTDDGVILNFSLEAERVVYLLAGSCFPFLWKSVSQLSLPMLLVYANESVVCKHNDVHRFMILNPHLKVLSFSQCSHLLPLECPYKVGAMVHDYLVKLPS